MSGELDTPRGGGQTPGGPCQFGLCDGSGFLLDEETNTTSDCRCRAGRIARRRTAGLEGRVPKHYRGVSFDRPPVPEIAARRAGRRAGGATLRASTSTRTSTQDAACG